MVRPSLLAASACLGVSMCWSPAWALGAGPTIRDLVEIADIAAPTISPDGRDVAYRIEKPSVAVNDTPTGWYVAPVDGSSPPRKVGDGGMAITTDEGANVELPLWSSDGRFVFYRAQNDGQVQVWRAAADGTGARAITHDAADVETFQLDEAHHRLVYRVGATRDAIARAEQSEYEDGILIDKTIDVAGGLYHNALIHGRPTSWRNTGAWFRSGGLLDAVPRAAHAVDLETLAVSDAGDVPPADIGSRTALWGQDEKGWYRIRTDSGDRRGQVAIRIDGTARSLVVTRPDGSAVTCRAAFCSTGRIDLAQWAPRDDVLLVTVTTDNLQQLYLWTVGAPSARLVIQGDGQWSGDRDNYYPCALGSTAIACVRADATTPPRLVSIALTDGKVHDLDTPNAAIAGLGAVHEEDLTWDDGAGQTFIGHLFVPAAAAHGRVPLFISYYICSGYLRGGTGDEEPLVPLAQSGIAALCIQRQSDKAGGGDSVSHYGFALSGIRAIIDRLDARGLIDRTRVGMGGLSFGTEVTAWVASHSNLVAAISTSSTLFEPTYWWFNGVAGRDIQDGFRKGWQIGAPDKTPDRWKQISTAAKVDLIHAPWLMQMPEQEYRLNMELYSRLTETGKAAEIYAFPDEPHIKTQPRHKLAVYQRNLDWFRYWLQAYVDPDPAKADQYRRWQAFAQKPAPATAAQGRPSQSRTQISMSSKVRMRK